MSSAPPPNPAAAAAAKPPAAAAPTAAAGAAAPAAAAPKKKTKAKSKSRAKTATKASGAAGTTAKARKPARKKKTTTKSSSAAAAQATLSGARAAQLDTAKQKAQAAAKRSDPLWYRIEDVLPTVRDPSPMTSANSTVLTEQVSIVENALNVHGLGRTDVTPQAMACLLEQARRYAQELIANAQDYCHIAGRIDVTRADFMLAAELRADHVPAGGAVSTQLPKLNLMAQQINRAPLPAIPQQCYSGVLLPPKPHQLTARTYDIVSGAHVTQKMVRAAPAAPAVVVSSSKKTSSSSSNNNPSYGAARGRQIPIKLKQQPDKTKAAASTTTAAASTTGGPTPMDISPSSAPKAPGAGGAAAMPPPPAPGTSSGAAATAPAPGAPRPGGP